MTVSGQWARTLLSLLAAASLLLGNQPQGNTLTVHPAVALAEGTLFAHPFAVGVDGHRNVYVVDQDNNAIVKLSRNGKLLTRWGSKGSDPGQFDVPYAVATDAQDNVYVTDSNNDRVEKFTSTGSLLTVFGGKGNDSFFNVHGLALDRSGSLYVGTGDGVLKLSPAGKRLATWPVKGAAFVHGVALDRAGNIFTSDWNDHITKLSPTGRLVIQWGKKGKAPGQLDFPENVATDAHGNVYVANWGDDRIEKFSSTGRLIREFGASPGSDPGQFYGPEGVYIDSHNALYVADGMNQRVQKLSSRGKVLAVWS